MSTPRRRRFEEGVNALLASLFILGLGLVTGFIVGVRITQDASQEQISAGYLSMAGKPYRVQPMEMR